MDTAPAQGAYPNGGKMRREILYSMGEDELDEYASTLGIDTRKAKGAKAKADLIEGKRERVAEVEAMGITVSIPIKRMHDKRITDKLNGKRLTDAQFDKLMMDLLGKEQYAAICEHVTDDDGTVDVDALGYILSKVVHSDELKNF